MSRERARSAGEALLAEEERQPASLTLYDGLGTATVREISVASLKSRFFTLGLRAGSALQMFVVCLGLVLFQGTNRGAIDQLSALYYPLFRALFLLSSSSRPPPFSLPYFPRMRR